MDVVSTGYDNRVVPSRVSPNRGPKIFLAEWRGKRRLTQEQLGKRVGVEKMTVSRWERGVASLNINVMQALADTLDIAPVDLFYHPDDPNLDSLLRNQPDEIRRQAKKLIEAILRPT